MSENSFESKLERLEQIVAKMNAEQTSLEESLKLFKEGQKLAKEASKALESAKLEIIKASENE